MIHISILVPEGDCSLTNIEGTQQILMRVNGYLEDAGRDALFDVHLVGDREQVSMKNGLFRVCPDQLIGDVDRTALIIIPSVHGDKYKIVADNRALLTWIVEQYRGDAAVASLCIGAFLLAGTGLLDGKSCTTHWAMAEDFRKMYPAVNLLQEKIITDNDNIYTSGGAYSWLNLVLYIVEKYAGRDIAVTCAKGFEIDLQRSSQSPFIIFSGQKDHEDLPIKKAQEYIERNVHSRVNVDGLASLVALSRRNLERRFKKATGNTVMEYVQRVKMEAVKKSLESSRLGVNEAMDKVGYSDPKAFRMIFKKVTGLSPVQYRRRYNREFV